MKGRDTHKPISASGMEMITLQISDWRANWLARGRSRPPNAWATKTELPIDNALSAAISKNSICCALPTPAIAPAPKCATSAVSTKPSNVSRKFSAMTGHAKPSTRLCTAFGVERSSIDSPTEEMCSDMSTSVYGLHVTFVTTALQDDKIWYY